MILAQNLPAPLAFFDAAHKQTYRHSYCNGFKHLIAVECRYDRLIAWIIQQTPETVADYVYLVTADGAQDSLSALDITTLLTLQEDTIDAVGYTFFGSDADIDQDEEVQTYSRSSIGSAWSVSGDSTWGNYVCDGGYYYLEIKIGSSVWHSELLHIVDFPEFPDEGESDSPYTRLRFEVLSNCTVAGIPTLSISQSFICFVNARAARPDYLLSKEVGKDGQEEESPVWTKIVKRYSLEFYGCETTCDFFATLPLYGTVNFADQYGVRTNITNIEVEPPSWDDIGNDCAALIKITFQRDFVSNTECC